MSRSEDHRHLHHAARLALRGRGTAAPNPMVGCVIVDDAGEIVGRGYHRAPGEPHGEAAALIDAGDRARGCTAYITLEPCNSTGSTGPCSQALVDAGVRRIVYARTDPHPKFAGGAQALREAGIDTELVPCPFAASISDAFVHRVQTGMPWVIAKWAQTLDGCIATRTGESQWISNEASRRHAHQERGRVDAILTAIGTVLADDPLLTARHGRVRRRALRVVIDPQLETPLRSRLVTSAADGAAPPVLIACSASAPADREAAIAGHANVAVLRGTDNHEVSVRGLLTTLVAKHEVCSVVVDGGPRLLGRLFKAGCVNVARVYVAPRLLGDQDAMTAVRGIDAATLTAGVDLSLRRTQRRGDDLILSYRVKPK